MAKYKGIVKLQGKIGDLTFKQVNGKGQVGLSSEVDKGRIEKDPAFARTRENNQEFGGSAKLAKAVRTALNDVFKSFSDKQASGRLVSLMRKVLNLGGGFRGQRVADLVNNGASLKGFELNALDKFGTKFKVPYVTSVNADRNELTVTIPDFHTVDDIDGPSFASHLRLVLAVGSVSNQIFDAGEKTYAPSNTAQEMENIVVRSSEIVIGGMVGTSLVLTAQLPSAIVLDPDVVLIGALGIEFLENVNGNYYVFATDNAMKIVEVV